MPTYKTSLERTVGTLYVIKSGARVFSSRESDCDPWLILDRDESGRIVGLALGLALDLKSLADWMAHPARQELPEALRAEVDRWYRDERPGQRAAMDDPEERERIFSKAVRIDAETALPEW